MQGVWVQSLVRELRSYMSCGGAKKCQIRKLLNDNGDKEFNFRIREDLLPPKTPKEM